MYQNATRVLCFFSFCHSCIWQTWKKNKGKRLVRSIVKKNRAANRFPAWIVLACRSYLPIVIRRDNASVPLYVVNEDNNEEVERARKKAEKEEREDRNRFVGFNYAEIILWLVKNKNYDAQEMEREEGEGVKGCVWAKGKEEGGQGHEEQDDGQGVEVPELQVLILDISCQDKSMAALWTKS